MRTFHWGLVLALMVFCADANAEMNFSKSAKKAEVVSDAPPAVEPVVVSEPTAVTKPVVVEEPVAVVEPPAVFEEAATPVTVESAPSVAPEPPKEEVPKRSAWNLWNSGSAPVKKSQNASSSPVGRPDF